MGMISNKVTRRIALGTIAGGLGGAALVLRALKGKYEIDLPQGSNSVSESEHYYKTVGRPTLQDIGAGDYAEEWNHYVNTVNVSIKAIGGPSSPTLRFKPQAGFDFQVLSVSASYDYRNGNAEYPLPPTSYNVMNGRVTSIEPIKDGRLALLIRTEYAISKSQHHRQELPNGECIVVPYNGTRDYYELVQSTPQRREKSQVNIPCALLGGRLTFRYPEGTTVARGTKWINPKKADADGGLSCEVVDFAEVAGRQTIKIVAEKQSSYEPALALVAVDATQQHSQEQLDKRMKQLSEEAKKDRASEKALETVHVTAYVDLATGITLRQESTITDQGLTTVVVTQVLDG